MPRLHGFHRFLPHLWELFYWAAGSPAAARPESVLGPVPSVVGSIRCWHVWSAINGVADGLLISNGQDGPARLLKTA
jgi:hypothetical protein